MLGGGPILIAGSEASESITRIHERVFTLQDTPMLYTGSESCGTATISSFLRS